MTAAIRVASFSDLPAVKTVALSSVWTKHVTHITYCNRGRFDGGDVLLALVDDKTAGFLIFRKRKTTYDIKIDMISVLPESMGTGVGRALIDHLREVTGNRALVLSVNKENESAIAFYKKYGFKQGPSTRDNSCWQMQYRGRGTLL